MRTSRKALLVPVGDWQARSQDHLESCIYESKEAA